MKPLIGIASCHVNRLYANSQRDSWIKDAPEGLDIKFFLGDPNLNDARSDEVYLGVGDGYRDCSAKSIEQCKWALEHGYTHMLKADLDTLIFPGRLMNSGFEKHDFVGTNHSDGTVSGGAGYWLSKKAMEVIAKLKWPTPPRYDEDRIVTWALALAGIMPHYDKRHKFLPGDKIDEDTITYHIKTCAAYDKSWELFDNGKYRPEYMVQLYRGELSIPEMPKMVVLNPQGPDLEEAKREILGRTQIPVDPRRPLRAVRRFNI